MNKLIEQLNNFVYDSEVDFFDINRAEAQAFINEIERLQNIIKEVRDEMERARDISVNDEYHIMEHEKKLLEILDKGE